MVKPDLNYSGRGSWVHWHENLHPSCGRTTFAPFVTRFRSDHTRQPVFPDMFWTRSPGVRWSRLGSRTRGRWVSRLTINVTVAPMPRPLINTDMGRAWQFHLRLLILVDVVNFVTSVKTAGVNRRREQATRKKFYVNKLGYGSTSGGRKIQAIASGLHRVDAVSSRRQLWTESLRLKHSGHCAVLRFPRRWRVIPSELIICRLHCHLQGNCRSVLRECIALPIT